MPANGNARPTTLFNFTSGHTHSALFICAHLCCASTMYIVQWIHSLEWHKVETFHALAVPSSRTISGQGPGLHSKTNAFESNRSTWNVLNMHTYTNLECLELRFGIFVTTIFVRMVLERQDLVLGLDLLWLKSRWRGEKSKMKNIIQINVKLPVYLCYLCTVLVMVCQPVRMDNICEAINYDNPLCVRMLPLSIQQWNSIDSQKQPKHFLNDDTGKLCSSSSFTDANAVHIRCWLTNACVCTV